MTNPVYISRLPLLVWKTDDSPHEKSVILANSWRDSIDQMRYCAQSLRAFVPKQLNHGKRIHDVIRHDQTKRDGVIKQCSYLDLSEISHYWGTTKSTAANRISIEQ